MQTSIAKHKDRLVIISAVILIALYAFYVRSSSLFETYVNADDPYLAYRLAEYFRQNLSLPENDTLRLYPYGWQYFKVRDHLLWYYTAGAFAYIFDILGFNNPTALALHFYPPFFAMLSVVLIFLITNEIFKNWKTALIASLILSSMPAIIYRTNSNFADKEPIATFFMLLSYLFYFKALRDNSRKSYYFAFGAGISLALMAMTWGGAELVITSYTLFALLLILLNRMNKDIALKHAIVSLTAYGIIALIPVGYFRWLGINNILNYIIILSSLLSFYVKTSRLPSIHGNKTLTLMLVSTIIAFTLASIFIPAVTKQLVNIADRLQQPLAKADVVASTVAENRPSDYSELARETGPLMALLTLSWPPSIALVTNFFFFSIFGTFIMLYELSENIQVKKLLLLAWFIVFVWAGIGAVRLIYVSGFPIAIIASYLLSKLLNLRPKVSEKTALVFRLFVVAFVAFVLIINAMAGYAFGQSLRPGMSKNWENALLWIKENSNETDVILSWWDYGYIIQFYAERPTYVDPGHPSWLFGKDITLPEGINSRDKQVARFFTSTNESEYIDWLKSINVRYVVHDISMIGKYSAVSTIASDGQFVDIIQIYPYQGSVCVEQVNNTCVKIVHKYGPIWLVVTNNSIQPVYVFQGFPTNISKVCTVTNVFVVDPNGMPGCVYLGNGAVAFTGIRCSDTGCQPYDLSDTIFVRMWFMDANGLQHFRKVYDNGEVKIFEVIY